MEEEKITSVATSMLTRYSTPKKALEMAQIHAHDSANPEHWKRVVNEIRRIAKLDAAGNPTKP